MFRLTTEENGKVVTNCDHLCKLTYANGLPSAYTVHSAIVAAIHICKRGVLRGERQSRFLVPLGMATWDITFANFNIVLDIPSELTLSVYVFRIAFTDA